MDVIITGLGLVGKTLTETLSREGHRVVVIDTDAQKVEETVNSYDVKGVVGNCASRDVLIEAGVADAEVLIAVTANDELNLLSCIIGKRLGAEKTIARTSKPEYLTLYQKDENIGVDFLVNPQHEAALEIVRMLRFPSAIKVNRFSERNVELVEFLVQKDSPLVGKSLRNVASIYNKVKFLICAAQRNGRAIIPSGNFIINDGDHLFLTATSKNIIAFFKELGWNRQCKSAILVGGSTTGYYLCKELENEGIRATLIEKDEDKCFELSEKLTKAEILCGDGTDQALLEEEGIKSTDAFVSITDLDEQNIILSMVAASKEVPKIITKINQPGYYEMLQKSGLYSAISTRSSAAEQIIRYVRLIRNKKGSGVKRLFRIIDESAEILEFIAEDNFKKFEAELQTLNLKDNLLIAGIVRDGDLITPSGKDVIKRGDTVIIVTLNEGLTNLNDILDY